MRFYTALFHLYPASFRAEYGDEMRAIYELRRRQAGTVRSRLLLWLDTLIDITWSAAAVHWDILRQDLRYTMRSLTRTPGFTITALVVTALGIGANTAAFSVADFVLIRPLPYADANRLVKLWQRPADGGTNELSPAIYKDWKASAKSFERMGAYYLHAVNLVGQGDPQRLEHAAVTADLLPILGVQPVRGRLFSASDEREGGSGTVIISYALWQSQFGGDAAIVGRRLLLDGKPSVVVGVMPRDFHYPNRAIDVWTPIGLQEQSDDDRTNTYWNVLAKLRPNVSVEQANAEMTVITQRFSKDYPKELENDRAAVIRLRDEFTRQSRLLLFALCGAAGCVLLIACANLANLLLARALTRRRELLVRSALGAGRERLVRQSITESLVLALLGGAAGIGLAIVSVPLLTRLVPTTLPIAQTPTVDMRIALFAGLLTIVTGVAFGVLPAWRSASVTDMSGLRDGARVGGGRRERARSVLVVAEVMASVVLLISSGLLMRALVRLQDADPGFKTENVMTLRTALPSPQYDSVARRTAFYRDVLTEVRAIPGVSSAAYISFLPIAMGGGIWRVVPEGQTRDDAAGRASSRFVTTGLFESLSIPIKRGRDVSESDDINQPYVAVVSESFVKRFFPNDDPIGRRFKFLTDTRTVVGVVGDVSVRGPEQTSEPQVYMSYKQIQDGQSTFFSPQDLVIHSTVPASTLISAIRRIVQRADPQQPISNIKPMAEIVDDATAARAVQVRVLGAFAAIAFLLAAVGIHGLLSFSVSTRRNEIGVRMALGAQRSEIVRMIMKRGVVLAAAGVIPGLAIAYVAGRAMQSLLAGIEPGDATTFGAAALLCIVMTLLGSLFPTLRAVRVDPLTAIRSEA